MATVDENRDSERLDEHVAPPFLRRVRIRGYKSIAALFSSLAEDPATEINKAGAFAPLDLSPALHPPGPRP